MTGGGVRADRGVSASARWDADGVTATDALSPFSSVHGALSATSKLHAPEAQPFAVRHSVEVQSVETQQSMYRVSPRASVPERRRCSRERCGSPRFRIVLTHLERLFPDPAGQDSIRQHVRGGGGLILPMSASPASAIPGPVGEGIRSCQHGQCGAEPPAKGAAP